MGVCQRARDGRLPACDAAGQPDDVRQVPAAAAHPVARAVGAAGALVLGDPCEAEGREGVAA
jgi:hypothetical protein